MSDTHQGSYGIYGFILKHFKNEDELAKKEQFLLMVMDDLKRQIPEKEILQYSLHVKEDYYVRICSIRTGWAMMSNRFLCLNGI